MKYTNLGLVAHAEKALAEGWYYLWGAYGQIATQAILDNNIKQYPTNQRWRSYAKEAINKEVGFPPCKTRFCDCYGLVKSYLWWVGEGQNPKYHAAQDRNTAGAYAAAKEKGLLATLPEVPGTILYMTGHVAVYCGKGRFIELQGGGTGAYEGRIEGGKITRGSKFTHWFKDTFIDYVEEEKREEIEMRYNTIDEVPDYAKEAIQYLVDKGCIADKNNLDLSHDMLRLLVINFRAGVYLVK